MYVWRGRAVWPQRPERKIAALNQYLKRPSSDLPDLLNKNDILRWLGRLYFESGNLTAAKESFLEMSEPNTGVQGYLKKIEAASKTAP